MCSIEGMHHKLFFQADKPVSKFEACKNITTVLMALSTTAKTPPHSTSAGTPTRRPSPPTRTSTGGTASLRSSTTSPGTLCIHMYFLYLNIIFTFIFQVQPAGRAEVQQPRGERRPPEVARGELQAGQEHQRHADRAGTE